MLSEPNISYKPFWGICRPLNSWRANSPNPIQIYCAIILTHRKDESYFEYISRVSTSKLAKKIKVADLLHNLDITRIKEPTKQDYQRLEKYKKAILYLATH